MIYDFFQIFGIYGRLENMADEFILQVALLLQPEGMPFRPVTNQFILDDIPDFICFFVVLVTGKHISEDCQKDCRCSQPLQGMPFRPVTNQFILDDIPDFICFFVVLVTGKHISEDCQKDCRCSQPLLTVNDFFHFSSVAFSGIRDHRSKKVAGRIFFCVGFFIKAFHKIIDLVGTPLIASLVSRDDCIKGIQIFPDCFVACFDLKAHCSTF